MRRFGGTALGWALLLCAATAMAAEEDTPDLSLEKEVASYLEEAQGDGAAGNVITWTFSKGLNWKSADGNFSGKFGGRLMIDWKWITSDDDDFDSDFTGDGVFARRIRLFVSGTVYKNVIYKLQIEFAGGPDSAPDPQDVFVGLKNIFLNGRFQAGHFFEMFSLEENTSSKYIGFIERSLPTQAFSPGRNVGFGFFHSFTEDKRLALEYGLFRTTDAGLMNMEDGGYALTVRVAAWFWEDEETNRIVHVGIGFSFRDPPGESARFRARPVGSGTRPLDTESFSADEFMLFNFEFLIIWKSLHVQAEFFAADGDTGADDAMFTGFYFEIGYFITGEHKGYSKKSFRGSRVKVKNNFHDGDDGGYGAVQILVRYSMLDLTDGVILGGESDTFTVGINWHWNPNTRVMFNVVFLDVENGADGSFTGDVTLLIVRWQFDF